MTLQNPADFELETGLEDFDTADMVTPRLTIKHKDGVFKDSLSGQEYDKIQGIILGLVRQRILWHKDVDEGDYPMCRSSNFKVGFPNLSDKVPVGKQFPWQLSGFNPQSYQPDDEGLVRLPCENCHLKEWGSHPDGNKPYCAEQFTIPILYDAVGDGIDYLPAIMSFQKTALKPLKAYLTGFQRNRSYAYSVLTEIGLDQAKRGSNVYSVPNFRKIGDTDDSNWRSYSASYRQLRNFLTEEPDVPEDTIPPSVSTPAQTEDVVEAEVVEDTPPKPPAGPRSPTAPLAPKSPQSPAAPVSTPSSGMDDDDLPF